MRKEYKILILLTGLLLSVNDLFAQGAGPAPCGDPDDPAYDPNMCPLDTWVIILAILALVFGYQFLKQQKKPLNIP